MPLSAIQHFRAVIRAAIPAAAFLAGWTLRPTVPDSTPAAHRPVSAAAKSRGAVVEKKAGAPGYSEAAGTPAEVPGGPAGKIAALLNKAAGLDARGVLAELKALDLQPGADGGLARQIYLARFGELDPQTALTYIDTLTAEERTASAATVMSAWAARDPQAAAAHLENENGGFGLDGDSSAEAARAVTAAWAEQNPAAATAWVQQLEDPSLRTSAVSALAAVVASQSPEKAAALISGMEADDQATAAGAAAVQWAQAAPAEAAGWARSLTGDAAVSAAEGVVSAWMLNDPAAASQWVKDLPSGEARDAAIVALTGSSAVRNDAASAVAWAAVIQDSSLRESALEEATRRWRFQQP